MWGPYASICNTPLELFTNFVFAYLKSCNALSYTSTWVPFGARYYSLPGYGFSCDKVDLGYRDAMI